MMHYIEESKLKLSFNLTTGMQITVKWKGLNLSLAFTTT